MRKTVKNYNDRRKDYEKSRDRRQPKSRRLIVQTVSGITKMNDLDEVDVPIREIFGPTRRQLWRDFSHEQEIER
jgi:hypothetical protein